MVVAVKRYLSRAESLGLSSVQGEKGDPGPTGPQGPQGDPGTKGDAGSAARRIAEWKYLAW